MSAPHNEPTSEAFLAVGKAILEGLKTQEYLDTRNPMPCWRNVSALIRSEPDDEKSARLVQAVSECINTELRPGIALNRKGAVA